MKALVYYGPNNRAFEDKPMPTIIDTNDAIVVKPPNYVPV